MGLLARPFAKLSRRGRLRYTSMAEVLSCFLDRKRLSELLSQTPDRRMLITGAAEALGCQPVKLVEQIASKLNLPFLARVEAMDISLLGVRKLSELRQMGAIMITSAGLLRGIACVDPWQIEILRRDITQLPVYLAGWEEIASALDRSEQEYIEHKEKERVAEALKAKQTAVAVLKIVVDEAMQFERERLLIAFEADQIEYSFVMTDGRSAVGLISQQIRTPLLCLLKEISGSAKKLNNFQLDVDRSVVIEKLNGQQIFTVAWGNVLEVGADISERCAPSVSKSNCKQSTNPQPKRKRKKKQLPKDRQVVMVVEDNVTFARVLERFLERHNIAVEHASDGLKALEMLEKHGIEVDLVVCDLHMPGMNGFEFLQRLRTKAEFIILPVIMLTSDDDLETELRALNDGADAFIPKSRDPRLLCAYIERQLKRKKELRAA